MFFLLSSPTYVTTVAPKTASQELVKSFLQNFMFGCLYVHLRGWFFLFFWQVIRWCDWYIICFLKFRDFLKPNVINFCLCFMLNWGWQVHSIEINSTYLSPFINILNFLVFLLTQMMKIKGVCYFSLLSGLYQTILKIPNSVYFLNFTQYYLVHACWWQLLMTLFDLWGMRDTVHPTLSSVCSASGDWLLLWCL